jgi:hypothetical protein
LSSTRYIGIIKISRLIEILIGALITRAKIRASLFTGLLDRLALIAAE